LVPFVKWYSDSARLKAPPRWTGAQRKHAGRGAINEGYIAFKNHLFEYSKPRPTTFFQQFNDKDPVRGFLHYEASGNFHDHYSEKYKPREDVSLLREQRSELGDKIGWPLLDHLIVAPNP